MNGSSTSLVRKTDSSKYYPVEKSANEVSSLESTDTLQTSNLPGIVPYSLIFFPTLTGIIGATLSVPLAIIANLMSTPLNKKKLSYLSIITGGTIRRNIAKMTSTIRPMSFAFMSTQLNDARCCYQRSASTPNSGRVDQVVNIA